MNFRKLSLSVAMSALLLSAVPIAASAQTVEAPVNFTNINQSSNAHEVHVLGTTPPALTDAGLITPFGANAPGSGASTHALGTSAYNYQVQSIGYHVYTEKWLSGASSMKVTVENWTKLEGNANSNKLDIIVCNSSGNEVASKSFASVSSATSATFTGLSSSAKYYVLFQVPTNGNVFSFNGTISKVN